MSSSRRRVLRPATIALSAAAFLALVAASISPLVPSASALDPTPDPSPSATAAPEVTPDPTVAPPDPTAAPTPIAATPDPATPAPPEPQPTATPEPVEDFPLYPLVDPEPPIIVPSSLIDPGQPSPHVMDSLVTDGCGACHRSHVASDEKLLIAAYRTDLKPTAEAYARAEFALCFTCHEPEPFEAPGTGGTNFDLHAQHLAELANLTPANANAVCAECHYRLHAIAGEAGSKLVNFAPNVVTVPLVPPWTGVETRSCTLTCHGYTHAAESY
jgi:hypothetical protein